MKKLLFILLLAAVGIIFPEGGYAQRPGRITTTITASSHEHESSLLLSVGTENEVPGLTSIHANSSGPGITFNTTGSAYLNNMSGSGLWGSSKNKKSPFTGRITFASYSDYIYPFQSFW